VRALIEVERDPKARAGATALNMSSRTCCGGFAVVVESASHLGGDYEAGTRRGAGLIHLGAIDILKKTRFPSGRPVQPRVLLQLPSGFRLSAPEVPSLRRTTFDAEIHSQKSGTYLVTV